MFHSIFICTIVFILELSHLTSIIRLICYTATVRNRYNRLTILKMKKVFVNIETVNDKPRMYSYFSFIIFYRWQNATDGSIIKICRTPTPGSAPLDSKFYRFLFKSCWSNQELFIWDRLLFVGDDVLLLQDNFYQKRQRCLSRDS